MKIMVRGFLGSDDPELRKISRSSMVERQVPIIEQCSLVPRLQIRLREGPSAAGRSGIGVSPASPLESMPPSTSGFGAAGQGDKGADKGADRDAPCNPLVASIWVNLRAMRFALYVTRYSEKCQTFSAPFVACS
jgi:hypothetical protein